jgi:hypothetical protein
VPPTTARIVLPVVAALLAVQAASAADGRRITGDPRPDLRDENRERRLTDREAAELGDRLRGKSEFAVLSRLGRPDRAAYEANQARLDYRFGRGWIAIRLRDGRVVEVGLDERQTGVREDDFIIPPVGVDPDPIGP